MNSLHIWVKDKEISRKEFLKILTLAGLGISLPFPLAKRAHASPPPNASNPQPFWVIIHAGGGWDPTSICDPKGGLVNHFPGGVNVNGFSLAPPQVVGSVRMWDWTISCFSLIPIISGLSMA